MTSRGIAVKTFINFKSLLWVWGAIIMVVAFNNCGEGFVVQQLTSGNGSVFFSQAPGQTCEDALLKVYQNTYHPFLNQTCNACHIAGPGIGTFASPDVLKSYESFSSIGMAKISSQAVNDAHKPPYTGSQNTGRVEELKSYWAGAQTSYVSCVANNNGGGGGGGGGIPGGAYVVKTTGKAVAANLATNFVRMEWDLETTSDAKVPLVAGIEIRRAVVATVTRGYEFRNPTLRLKNAAAGPHSMRALNIFVNGNLLSEVTTYSNLEATITATTDLNLAPGYANALAVLTPATTDMIALEFSSLKSGAGGGTNPTPTPVVTVTPTPTPTPAGAVKFSDLIAAGGLFTNNCVACHSAANPRGGLDITNYNAAKTAAATIKFRVNNAANPMPTGGLLPANQRDAISAWVDQGAPQ